MKRKYYLIDTENVGDRWFGLMEKMKKKDRFVIFYTQNHSKRLEEFILRQINNPRIIWLECAVGNNALDYQLVGVLAYLVVKHPKASFCIYSNDKGYQKTVEFWTSRGIQISQKCPGQKKKEKKKDKKKTKQIKNNQGTEIKAQSSRMQAPKERKLSEACILGKKQEKLTDEEYVDKIAGSVPVSNLNGWYCALTVILGQTAGREWYQKIRNDMHHRELLSKFFTGDRFVRGVNLTALVLHANHLDAGRAQEAYQIIQSHDYRDLNAIKIDFDKFMEPKAQSSYYKVLRPIVSLLREL